MPAGALYDWQAAAAAVGVAVSLVAARAYERETVADGHKAVTKQAHKSYV